jgi:DNA polymerase III epsilon subunit-like protein
MSTQEGEMDFVALDIETANSDAESIYEIGVVKFQQGIDASSERIARIPGSQLEQ